MHQTKTSILCIITNHIPPYLVCGLDHVPIATRATWQQIRLIDNLDSGHVDIVSDIPRLSTNEKAGVGGVAAESGRIYMIKFKFCLSETPLTWTTLALDGHVIPLCFMN